MRTKTADHRYFARGEEALDLELSSSEGCFYFDSDGKRYIDFLSGSCVGNLGWGMDEIDRAVRMSPRPAYVPPDFIYKPWAELSRLLAEITPGKLQKCYRTTGGSEAVEAAMQIAMIFTGRNKFLSVEGSYHGNTIGALSIGSTRRRNKYPAMLPGCFKAEPPLNMLAAKKAEEIIKTEQIAAFIMEPIGINLGVHIPDPDFMHAMAGICHQYGTLLIMDEVATGFGRTGKLFASEHYDIDPDIICLAKALSGGYAGLGATIITEEIADKMEEGFSLYSTYGWHPIAVDAALANVRYWMDHKERLLEHVEVVSGLFRQKLEQMKFPLHTKLNMIGLAIGIDTGDDKFNEKLVERCFNKGLILSSEGSKLVMFPPLILDKATAEEGLNILENCL